MPFIAVDQQSKRVDITDYQRPKIELSDQDLFCPYCHIDFIIVSGEKVASHFRHKQECQNPIAAAYFSGETEEHRQAKTFIKQQFIKELRNYTRLRPELEVLAEPASRIADVMISYPFGYRQAIEIQLSRVSLENIQERTEDYFQAGIDVFWLLGPEAREERIVHYLQSLFGECYYVTPTGASFRLSKFIGWESKYTDLWKELLRLAIVRYLQVYRAGLAPDFRQAISGHQKIEYLFGSNLGTLKKAGAVEDLEECLFRGYRYPVKFWKLSSPKRAVAWLKQRHIRPMRPEALEVIQSRSVHKSILAEVEARILEQASSQAPDEQ